MKVLHVVTFSIRNTKTDEVFHLKLQYRDDGNVAVLAVPGTPEVVIRELIESVKRATGEILNDGFFV